MTVPDTGVAWRLAKPVVYGTAAAFAGGLGATALGMPAPWVSGGTMGAAAAALAGVPVGLPNRLRNVVFVALGMTMGAGVSPETVAQVGQWPASLAILAATVIAVIVSGTIYLEKIGGFDRISAFLASIPGALSSVMAVALAINADSGRIGIQQTMRLLLLVAILPLVIAASGVPMRASMPPMGSLSDLALLVIAATIGAVVAERIRMPAGTFNGSFMTSAALHGSGLIHGALPQPLQIACLVLLSAGIGGRLSGMPVRLFVATLKHGFIAFVLSLTVCAIGVAAVVSITHSITFAGALLAFAPGGLEAMMVLAYALGIDPAYVATHHFARFVGVALSLPVMLAVVRRTLRSPGGTDD